MIGPVPPPYSPELHKLLPTHIGSKALDDYVDKIPAAIDRKYMVEHGATALVKSIKDKYLVSFFPIDLAWHVRKDGEKGRIVDTTKKTVIFPCLSRCFHVFRMNSSCFEKYQDDFKKQLLQIKNAYYLAMKPVAMGNDKEEFKNEKIALEKKIVGHELRQKEAEADVEKIKKELEELEVGLINQTRTWNGWDGLIQELKNYNGMLEDLDKENLFIKAIAILKSSNEMTERKRTVLVARAKLLGLLGNELKTLGCVKTALQQARACRKDIKASESKLKANIAREKKKKPLAEASVDLIKKEIEADLERILGINEELKKPPPVPMRLNDFLLGLGYIKA